ncbi:uncharacterized protein LOC129724589 [Wyeomyia smithii]|uniref:uncharacterized protein LOC129724589 n=1 Tax=Wyeomyia smithii TaxID=174621 RepID=UPI002467CC13|nr:uncharacterized protein LOC129724589 [Wyeomyia smithii]
MAPINVLISSVLFLIIHSNEFANGSSSSDITENAVKPCKRTDRQINYSLQPNLAMNIANNIANNIATIAKNVNTQIQSNFDQLSKLSGGPYGYGYRYTHGFPVQTSYVYSLPPFYGGTYYHHHHGHTHNHGHHYEPANNNQYNPPPGVPPQNPNQPQDPLFDSSHQKPNKPVSPDVATTPKTVPTSVPEIPKLPQPHVPAPPLPPVPAAPPVVIPSSTTTMSLPMITTSPTENLDDVTYAVDIRGEFKDSATSRRRRRILPNLISSSENLVQAGVKFAHPTNYKQQNREQRLVPRLLSASSQVSTGVEE